MPLAELASLLYLASVGLLGHGLTRAQPRPPRLAALLAGVAIALHLMVHVARLRSAGAIDLHFFAALSLVGVVLAALTLVLGLMRPVAALGVVVYPVATATLLLYRFGAQTRVSTLPDWPIQLHAGLALLAYATLSLAALVAIMLWWQERALRRRQLATALRAFPPLTLLEALLFRLIAGGFALLTLALLSGAVFVENLFAQHLMHKTVLSLLAWATFGALLFGRMRYGWRGRRAIRLTLIAMALLGLAFFGSKFVLELVLERSR
jgi:ABC-type uncharacterized transport system permease subunit